MHCLMGKNKMSANFEKVTRLLIATHNKGKLAELSEILSPLGIEIISPSDVGLTLDPEETGTTFEENAMIKAVEYCKASGIPSVADDSGLCIDALGGEPGIYSARYGGEELSFTEKSNLLLERLADVPDEKRGAHFGCAMAFAAPDGRSFCVYGRSFGVIAHEQRGDKGFGYDPIFYVPEESKTFAELDESIKNKISHRANASKLFFEEIKKYI